MTFALPPRRPPNRAQLRQVFFRLTDQTGFFVWLVGLLRRSGPMPVAPEDGRDAGERAAHNALNRLNPKDGPGFVAALIKGWAAVGDVLTFYQERLANEGYLRTALQARSVAELGRMVGYQPRPGLSATTFLSFRIIDVGQHNRPVVIPAGTPVKSVPAAGALPVTFETDRELLAHADWSVMTTAAPPERTECRIRQGACAIKLAGRATGIRAGLPLLLQGRTVDGVEMRFARVIQAVEYETRAGVTWVRWAQAEPWDGPDLLAEPAKVWVLRQQVRLFDIVVPAWASLPESIKAQYGIRQGDVGIAPFDKSLVRGLPPGDLATLAVTGPDTLVAVIGDGLWECRGDDGWSSLGRISSVGSICCLVRGYDKRLYVGTSRGEVLISGDDGRTWFSVQASAGTKLEKGEHSRLPAAAVTAILPRPGAHGAVEIVAGTTVGIWHAQANSGHWRGWNKGLPGFDEKSGSGAVAVHALIPSLAKSHRVVAATDKGLFHADKEGEWKAARKIRPLHEDVELLRESAERGVKAMFEEVSDLIKHDPLPAAKALAALVDKDDEWLFASHQDGVLFSRDGGEAWEDCSGAPAAGAIVSDGVDLYLAAINGVLLSTDRAKSWQPAPGFFGGQPAALLAAGAGKVAAAAKFTGFTSPGEDSGTIRHHDGKTEILLDRPYAGLASAGFAVRTTKGKPPELFEVAAAVETMHSFRQISRRVTRLELIGEPTADPAAEWQLYAGGSAFDLSRESIPAVAVVQGNGPVLLTGAIAGLSGRKLAITGRRARLRLCMLPGGVRHWDPVAALWQPVGRAGMGVNCLLSATTPSGRVLYRGGERGVEALRDGCWQSVANLAALVNALQQDEAGDLWAGTDAGVWRLTTAAADADKEPAWQRWGLAAIAVTTLGRAPDGSLWAGTGQGLYALDLQKPMTGNAECAAASHGQTITALQPSGDCLWASTASGAMLVWRDGLWQTASPPPVATIAMLAADGKAGLFAATNRGCFRWEAGGTAWKQETGQPAMPMRAVALDDAGTLWTAGEGVGVLRAGKPAPAGIANVVGGFVCHDGALYAAFRFATAVCAKDGENLWLEPHFLGLLHPPAQLPDEGPLEDAWRARLEALGPALPKEARVATMPGFGWRIGAAGEAAGILVLPPLSDDPPASPWRCYLTNDHEVMAAPTALAADPRFEIYHLRCQDGVIRTIMAGPEEVMYQAGGTHHPNVAEVVTIESAVVTPDGAHTMITFDPPLTQIFDASQCRLNANVVEASHGESPVLYEPVGSGDAAQGRQKFPLRRAPLTALADSREPFFRYAISVRVRPAQRAEALSANSRLRPEDLEAEAMEWCYVSDLSQSGPSDRHFTVERSTEGQVSLLFGDGAHGKRLPTGAENVAARYRVGSGAAGNLAAGRLVNLARKPAGVKRVTNPIPASGGADAEGAEDIRQKAPLLARDSGRLVSRRDYEDFIRAWPGVAKVSIRQFTAGHRFLHVSIADQQLANLVPGDVSPPASWPSLHQAIGANALLHQSVRLEGCLRSWFSVEADILVEQGHDGPAVLAAVRSRLIEIFGFAACDLAKPVRASAVTAEMQRAEGVKAVFLHKLFLSGHKPELCRELPAPAASLTLLGQILPATLLLIDPRTPPPGGGAGILLREVRP